MSGQFYYQADGTTFVLNIYILDKKSYKKIFLGVFVKPDCTCP